MEIISIRIKTTAGIAEKLLILKLTIFERLLADSQAFLNVANYQVFARLHYRFGDVTIIKVNAAELISRNNFLILSVYLMKTMTFV